MRRPRLRITLLNLIVAIAVLAVTLAATRPGEEIRPMYLAVTWMYVTTASHDPAAHAAWRRDLTSDAVLRATLADPDVAALPRFQGSSDPLATLRRDLIIWVHPRGQGYYPPGRERLRAGIESRSASEANLLKNAFVRAYLAHHRLGRIIAAKPVRPERSTPPVFDRPWKFVAANALGLSLAIGSLFIPMRRVRGRAGRLLEAAAVIGLAVGAVVWWLVAYPEVSWRIGGSRVF